MILAGTLQGEFHMYECGVTVSRTYVLECTIWDLNCMKNPGCGVRVYTIGNVELVMKNL